MTFDAKLTFHGAAGTVTGSCSVLEAAGQRWMIDCGLFQGSRSLEELNRAPFAFDPRDIDGVLLTHAHIDHCGLLPRLVKEGFRGPIYCTRPTADLLGFTLPDAGRIQEAEADRGARRRAREGREPYEPLYTEADARRVLEQTEPVALEQWRELGHGWRFRLWNAGHILGSASVEICLNDEMRLLFSGDLGPDEKAFHPEPNAPAGFDVVVCESTYGDREKSELSLEGRRQLLLAEVETALARGGNLIIPAFAIERTQELLLDLAILMAQGKLARTPVFIDSPLASNATSVFRRHAGKLEDLGDIDVFGFPAFHFVETAQHSMQLNVMSGAIIIAASGMCEAGRVRHHLKHNLWRPESTVLFVGYQAQGTLGRTILEGARRVRISGTDVAVRARIRRIDSYSAHADQGELLAWINARQPIRGGLFLCHGEEQSLAALAAKVTAQGIEPRQVFRPQVGESFRLRPNERPTSLGGMRIAPAEAAHDWQNEYAAIMVDLKDRLRHMRDNQQRERTLLKMREVLNHVNQTRGTRAR